MQVPMNRASWIAAGTIVAAGAAWAGSVALTPPAYQGPDVDQVQALAASSTDASIAAPAPMGVVPAGRIPASFPTPAPMAEPVVAPVRTVPSPAGVEVPPARIVRRGPAEGSGGPARQYRVFQSSDPVKNLALVGVTHEGSTDTAWLYDLESRTRENVMVGEKAFGFTVRKIDDESVRLVRGGSEFVLHLGQKQIPVVTPVADNTSTGNGDAAAPVARPDRAAFTGQGRRQFGSGSDEDRANYFRQMRQQARSQNEDEGDGNRRGPNSGRRDEDNFADDARSRSGNDDRTADSSNPRNRNTGGDGRSGAGNENPYGNPYAYGYAPYAFGGNGYGPNGFGGNGPSNSQFSSTGRSTSVNPQTARRRGTNLGGAGSGVIPANEGPAPIANPQTQRRIGTNSGPAFGEENNSNRRTGTNRENPGSRSGPSR